MEQFDAYSHAIVSMAAFALIGLILGPVSAAKKGGAGLTSGAMPEADYANPVYRLSRAYMNAVETSGFFVAVTAAAILAGGSPFWVNLLASVFLVSRIAVAYVHIRGIGAQNQGLRTMIYVIGWLCCLVLGLIAILAAF